MSYDFDVEVDREGTGSVKWEFMWQGDDFVYKGQTAAKHGPDRVLSMWVADMDFRAPQAVIDALVARAAHGIYGYTAPMPSYFAAVMGWAERRYGWRLEEEWIKVLPGIVPALYLIVRTFTEPGGKVLIQRPVYHPFSHAIERTGRRVVSNSLVLKDGSYEMDFEDLARKAADPEVTLAILCSPHNPVGRVWSREELKRFGEICLENNVLVVSDEIHCDLIFPGKTFTPFASVDERFAQHSITGFAPSKTFNLAGLKVSNIVIPNAEIRQTFAAAIESSGLPGMNAFGLVAAEAAYNEGEQWLEKVMDYVAANYRYMADFLASCLPEIKPIAPEGTYLAWLDCRELGLTAKERLRLLREEAKIYLNEGEIFGEEGAGFERINLACPRTILQEALTRLHAAVSK